MDNRFRLKLHINRTVDALEKHKPEMEKDRYKGVKCDRQIRRLNRRRDVEAKFSSEV